MTATVIDLRRVADLMRAQGIFAEVWMTGGGVHTLYAGPTVNERYTLAAGPANAEAKISVADLVYGPDDDGIADPLTVEAHDEPAIALIFLAFVEKHAPPTA